MRPPRRDPPPSPVEAARGQADERLEFGELYEHQFDYVCRVVARLSGRSDVEDLVQEVFVVAHRRLPEFEGRARVTTWLFRIAHRVVGAHIRHERRWRALRRLLGHSPAEEIAAPPLRLLEEAERARAVAGALEALPWKKRTVLVLFEVEEWSCAQIAEALEIPVKTVYTRLHHARREMALALGSTPDGSAPDGGGGS